MKLKSIIFLILLILVPPIAVTSFSIVTSTPCPDFTLLSEGESWSGKCMERGDPYKTFIFLISVTVLIAVFILLFKGIGKLFGAKRSD